MNKIDDLLKQELVAINLGLDRFYDDLKEQKVKTVQVNWKPPAANQDKIDRFLAGFKKDRAAANKKAVKRIEEAEVFLIDAGIAKDTLPGMKDKMILHAGPPVTWERMCGPMRGAVIGAIQYEGWAKSEAEAEKLAATGEITYEPNHHHQAVGPMAGIISPTMPVFIMENRKHGNFAYTNMNEGLGKVLRFGANSEAVITRLHWMRDVLYPVMKDAVKLSGGIDWKTLVVQSLQSGDDCHNRNRNCTALFAKTIASYIAMCDYSKKDLHDVLKFIDNTEHFSLNLTMAMCKASADAAAGIEGSTIVTAMCRNGTDFGIRLSGTGDEWFVAPANTPVGLFFPGFTQEDANPDIGDSTITETIGIGGFSMAAAPAIVKFVGGTVKDSLNFTLEMYEITETENENFKIPALDFRGSPTGIDLVKVLETGILPRINTGMAHKKPGIGQVGAGLVQAPIDCFIKAAEYLQSR
ncbi:MAG: DUF1116 domain-containing protein [Spirochaetes bacterium]|nr:DUF1116 domain-containing protein [Spirochaetota bacterium]